MVKINTAKAVYSSEPSKMANIKTTQNVVFTPKSDEELIKNYVKNVPLSDLMPQKWKNLGMPVSSMRFGPEKEKNVIPTPIVPSTDYEQTRTAEAFQRERYKWMDMENFAPDLENALKTYEKVSSGWQDAETMKKSKEIIQKAHDRLVTWQEYNKDYNIGVDYQNLLNAYTELLNDWDGIAEKYGKYKNAEEYNAKVKYDEEKRKVVEELPLISHDSRIASMEYALEEANRLYGDLYYAQQMTSKATTPEEYEERSQKEQEALKEYKNYLKMFGYGTKEEMEEALGTLKAIRGETQRYQDLQKLSNVGNPESEEYDKDFKEYVKKGVEIATGDENDIIWAKRGHMDFKEAAYAQFRQRHYADKLGGDEDFVNFVIGPKNKQFTEQELDLLAYWIGKDGKIGGKQADKYLTLLEKDINERRGQEIFDTYLKDNTVLETLYAIPVNLDRFGSNLANLFNTEDDYIPLNSTQVAGQLAREDLADNGQKLPEWLGGGSGAQLSYDMLGTTAYMLPSILVGFVSKTAGATLMGAAAAGNAYQEGLNAGMDKGQARTYSTLVGVSEAVMSRVLSKAFGGKAVSGKVATAIKGVENGLARWALNTGVAFVSEATEEGLQEILTPIFENIALGYNKNGFEDIDWSEVAYSALMGGLSGGAFETLESGVKRIANGINVRKDYNTDSKVAGLLKLGLSFDKNSKAYKLANKYSAEFTKNKGISSRKVYNLANTLQNTVGYTLMKLGETENVDTLASVIVKKLSGVELSTKEIELLSKNSYGQETLNTYTPKVEAVEESTVAEVPTVDTGVETVENVDVGTSPTSNEVDIDTDSEDVQERGLGFTEPTDQEIYRDPTPKENQEAIFGKRKNAKQRHIFDVAKKLDNDLKVVFVPKDSKVLNGKNGKFNRNTKTIYIAEDLKTTEMYAEVFKHEFVHRLELRKLYGSFKNYLFKRSEAFGDYAIGRLNLKDEIEGKNKVKRTREQAVNELIDMYVENTKGDLDLTREEAEREAVADFVARTLFKGNTEDLRLALKSDKGEDFVKLTAMPTDLALFEEMARTDRNLLQKIIDAIKDLIASIKGMPNLEKDLRYIEERLIRVYQSADSKKVATESGEVKMNYEIYSSDNGKKYVYIKPNSIDLNNGQSIAKNIATIIENKFNNLIFVNGQYFRINATTNKEFTGSDWARALKREHPDWFEDKIQTIAYADEILKSAKNWINQKPKHPRNDKITSFGHGEIFYKVGDNGYSAEVIVGLKDDGSAVLYDIINITNKKIVDTNDGGKGETLSSDDVSTKNNITNSAENVKQKQLDITLETNDEGQYAVAENIDNEQPYSSDDLSVVQEQLLDRYEKGEITREEYQSSIKKYFDDAIAEVQDIEWEKQRELINRNVSNKKRIKRQNEQLAKSRAEIRQEERAKIDDRDSKQKNIEYIRKTVKSLYTKLTTNNASKHIPEQFKKHVESFLSVFYKNDRSPFDRKNFEILELVYDKHLNAETEGMEMGFDSDIKEILNTFERTLDGKTLRDLNVHETRMLKQLLENFSQIINWEDKMRVAGKEYETDQIGHKAIKELESKEAKRENAITEAKDKWIVYSNMTPAYFFNKIGGVFKTLYEDIVEAQNKWFRKVENGKTFIRQLKKKHHYSKWKKRSLELETEKGGTIELTIEQAMLLLATAKREYGNEWQKAEHLFRGGIVIPPTPKEVGKVAKEIRSVLKEKNGESKANAIIKSFTREVNSRPNRITPEDVLKIKEWLTDEQIAYVDEFVEYLSTDMAHLGNEVSLELYGIKKYNEDYYIPYNSAENFLFSQPGITNEARLKHQSFTKDTQHGADTPLVLADFSTVCADHINRMCMYNAFTVPLENLNRIFNYKIIPSGDEDANQKSVKSEIERVYGAAAKEYIETFIKDMNGNARVDNSDRLMNRMISKFKKGAVFASASVVIQQPSAIIRAMAYINPKYFVSTAFKFSERDYQQCVRYAPVAGIKEMGRFDTGVGASTVNWLLQETPEGIKEKTKALFSKDSTYRDDKLSYFAAKADEITWAHLWAAVKAEIADTTDLKVGSQEYFEACGKRMTEVVNLTQVYDSTLSRSQVMRSKSIGAQMLTSFASEPTVSLNLLIDAADKLTKGSKKDKAFALRAIGAFVGSVAANALLKSLVTAARDDDEEKSYAEKYIRDATHSFISDVIPLNLIPFVKDVISIFEGYTVERADMNLFSDLAQSLKYLSSDSKSGYEKFEGVLSSVAAFFGLPVKNILRDGKSVYNLYKDFFVNENKTTWQGIKFSVADASLTDIYEDLVEAAEEDDEETYQAIYKELIDLGKNENDIKKGIKKAYRESEDVENESKNYIKNIEKSKSYKALEKEDKEELQKDIASKLATEKAVKILSKKPDRFDELYKAYRTNKAKYKKMKQEMLDEGISESLISDGFEMARIAYMKSQGIDIGEYLLYKISTSEKYADKDNSGGLSQQEKSQAIREMDIDEKAKKYFLQRHK